MNKVLLIAESVKHLLEFSSRFLSNTEIVNYVIKQAFISCK